MLRALCKNLQIMHNIFKIQKLFSLLIKAIIMIYQLSYYIYDIALSNVQCYTLTKFKMIEILELELQNISNRIIFEEV
jgi:hypothetical protein